MNIYVIIGAVIAFAAWTWGVHHQGYTSGQEDCQAEMAKREGERKSMTEEVRTAVNDAGAEISKGLEARIRKIQVNNTTVVNEIQREKEVHHVLTDANCGVPVSTVKLLNAARRDADPGAGPTPGKPDGAVPAVAPAAGGQAAPAR